MIMNTQKHIQHEKAKKNEHLKDPHTIKNNKNPATIDCEQVAFDRMMCLL